MDKRDILKQNGKYIVGDSAYALRTFLLTPYDNAKHGTKFDAYNYHHSSCRISIECCFGELHQRWGILWRPLRFNLSKNIIVIDAGMRLHNYIIDYDILMNTNHGTIDHSFYDIEAMNFMAVNPLDVFGVFGDGRTNSEHLGRPTRLINILKEEGKLLRQHHCDNMEILGLKDQGLTISVIL